MVSSLLVAQDQWDHLLCFSIKEKSCHKNLHMINDVFLFNNYNDVLVVGVVSQKLRPQAAHS